MARSASKSSMRGTTARRRVVTAGLVGAVLGSASTLVVPWQLAPLLGWDFAAICYVTWIWLKVWPLDARETASHADREDPTRAAADALLLGAAVASLAAIGYVLVRANAVGGLAEGVRAGFAVASVLVSWSVIHTVFALRYARLYYSGEDGGADFHQTGPPRIDDLVAFGLHHARVVGALDHEQRCADRIDVGHRRARHQELGLGVWIADPGGHHRPPGRRYRAGERDQVAGADDRDPAGPVLGEPAQARQGGEPAVGAAEHTDAIRVDPVQAAQVLGGGLEVAELRPAEVAQDQALVRGAVAGRAAHVRP